MANRLPETMGELLEFKCGVEKETEERIIKSLESLFDKAENAETRRFLTMGIALIKGETE